MRSIGRITGAVVLAMSLPAGARAETVNCSAITAVPTTISTPGVYCLRAPLTLAAANAAKNGITITASDVVLDLNGWSLTGPGTSNGIIALAVRNVTVRNGTVRGFINGVSIGTTSAISEGHLVEGLQVDQNISQGIYVTGKNIRVYGNTVSRTSGGSLGSAGIGVAGSNAHVADNQVVETIEAANGVAYGIRVAATPAAVERNVISNQKVGPNQSHGIYMHQAKQVAVTGNRIANMRIGINYAGTGTTASTGIYMDNTVGGATSAFSGGIGASQTNFSMP